MKPYTLILVTNQGCILRVCVTLMENIILLQDCSWQRRMPEKVRRTTDLIGREDSLLRNCPKSTTEE